jgi:hypothetical protein
MCNQTCRPWRVVRMQGIATPSAELIPLNDLGPTSPAVRMVARMVLSNIQSRRRWNRHIGSCSRRHRDEPGRRPTTDAELRYCWQLTCTAWTVHRVKPP